MLVIYMFKGHLNKKGALVVLMVIFSKGRKEFHPHPLIWSQMCEQNGGVLLP